MKDGFYNDIKDVFGILNSQGITYLILRNYENLLSPEMYLDGHGDIDMLCDDSQVIVRLLGAKTNRKDENGFIGDGTHYYIYVKGEYVSLDLRHIGDGYYCQEWQKEMLEHRKYNNGFYVMNQEDYFYSLIYHAILQKRSLSEEYRQRLTGMATSLGISLTESNEKSFIDILNRFMKKNKYKYVYSKDIVVPNRFSLVDRSLITSDYKLQLKHWKFNTKVKAIEIAVNIKHILERIINGHI